MQKTDKTPLWVFLAYSSIETRRGAWLLIISCILFTAYCVPWASLFPENALLGKVFLLEDWEWFAMMIPFTLWYYLALRWADKHQAWSE